MTLGLRAFTRHNVITLSKASRGPHTYPIRKPFIQQRSATWLNPLSWRLPGGEPGTGSHPECDDYDFRDKMAKDAVLEKLMQGRQPADLMLRCTILDAEGNVKTISGQFKKSSLCSDHRLNPRDLRKIDSRVPNLVPTILVRKEAFLVNILHIRALVKADEILLFDTYGSSDSRLHSVFLYHLEHNLKTATTTLPYEFRALESILLSVLSALEAEVVLLRNLVGGLLAALEDDIDRDKFMRLLHAARRLSAFQNRARLVQSAIEEVLEQDEDLQAMHLSVHKMARAFNPDTPDPAADIDHSELEVLLESFEKQVAEVANEAENLQSNVAATQEIVELVLDANRNALLALDLRVSIGTMGLAVGALVASLFGMNLPSHLEESPYAFAVVSGLAGLVSGGVAAGGLRRLAKIRKVGLSTAAPGQMNRSRPPGLTLPMSLRERKDPRRSEW